jgi:hypothetical protein
MRRHFDFGTVGIELFDHGRRSIDLYQLYFSVVYFSSVAPKLFFFVTPSERASIAVLGLLLNLGRAHLVLLSPA